MGGDVFGFNKGVVISGAKCGCITISTCLSDGGGFYAKFFITCNFKGFIIHIDIIRHFTGFAGFIISYLSSSGIAIGKVDSVIS